MFSLKHTVFILSAVALSATAVQLAAQDAAPNAASSEQKAEEEPGSLIRRGIESLKKGAADINAGTSGLVKEGIDNAKDEAKELVRKGREEYRKGVDDIGKGVDELKNNIDELLSIDRYYTDKAWREAEEIKNAADELIKVFNQSSVLIQQNPTKTEFYTAE